MTFKVAAVGDVHFYRDTLFSGFDVLRTDALLLAGDLTERGEVFQATNLARHLDKVEVPKIAVLGNHDYADRSHREIVNILEGVGVEVLGVDGPEGIVLEKDGLKVGIAGVKGFAGGFGIHDGAMFGEPEQYNYMAYTYDEAEKLKIALQGLEADTKIALLHYAPFKGTLKGEHPEIFAWLGSSALGDVCRQNGADLILHGHAHHGTFLGRTVALDRSRTIQVRNVAWNVLQELEPPRDVARFVYHDGRWSDG